MKRVELFARRFSDRAESQEAFIAGAYAMMEFLIYHAENTATHMPGLTRSHGRRLAEIFRTLVEEEVETRDIAL